MNAPALQIEKLSRNFGGLKALCDLTLEIPEKMIFGLIGPNGAGKTTVFNLLTGVYRPTSGTIEAFGKSLIGKATHQITACGVARTFQNIRLFKDLTVADNVMIAMDNDPAREKHDLIASVFRTRRAIATELAHESETHKLLELFGLADRERTVARNLPYGDQRRLEIARALATGARLLLLDEPAAGMNAQETAGLVATIRLIRERFGVTILLIEHDMRLIMGLCERIAVLDHGVKIAEGTASEVQNNPKVIEAYLGSSRHD